MKFDISPFYVALLQLPQKGNALLTKYRKFDATALIIIILFFCVVDLLLFLISITDQLSLDFCSNDRDFPLKKTDA